MRLDADRLIEDAVGTVNTLLSDIHTLNQQIATARAASDTAPDLEDERDRLINQLAEEIDIKHFTRSSGEVVILTGSGRALLDSVPVTLVHNAAAQLSPSVTLGSGISGILFGSAGPDITEAIPVVQDEQGLEYEISSRIRQLTQDPLPVGDPSFGAGCAPRDAACCCCATRSRS